MKRKAHIVFSIIIAILGLILIETLREKKIPDLDLLGSIFTTYRLLDHSLMLVFSIMGSLIPDVLDPAYTRHHRGFAHSKMMLLSLSIFFIITLFYLLDSFNRGIWSLHFFLLGYISHLLLDSLTPAGLT